MSQVFVLYSLEEEEEEEKREMTMLFCIKIMAGGGREGGSGVAHDGAQYAMQSKAKQSKVKHVMALCFLSLFDAEQRAVLYCSSSSLSHSSAAHTQITTPRPPHSTSRLTWKSHTLTPSHTPSPFHSKHKEKGNSRHQSPSSTPLSAPQSNSSPHRSRYLSHHSLSPWRWWMQRALRRVT